MLNSQPTNKLWPINQCNFFLDFSDSALSCTALTSLKFKWSNLGSDLIKSKQLQTTEPQYRCLFSVLLNLKNITCFQCWSVQRRYRNLCLASKLVYRKRCNTISNHHNYQKYVRRKPIFCITAFPINAFLIAKISSVDLDNLHVIGLYTMLFFSLFFSKFVGCSIHTDALCMCSPEFTVSIHISLWSEWLGHFDICLWIECDSLCIL